MDRFFSVLLCLLSLLSSVVPFGINAKPTFAKSPTTVAIVKDVKRLAAAFVGVAGLLSLVPDVALAVSGGGLDYATKNLKEDNFSGRNEKGKDFTQCDAAGVKFRTANLDGTRFYRAKLSNADFTGASLQSASLEDTVTFALNDCQSLSSPLTRQRLILWLLLSHSYSCLLRCRISPVPFLRTPCSRCVDILLFSSFSDSLSHPSPVYLSSRGLTSPSV